MKIKKILSLIVSAAFISAAAGSVVSAETAEPNFPMHGNRCGKVLVESDIERDIEVTITQNTQDGDFKYYTVVIPQGDSEVYEFVLEGNNEASYTVQLGVSEFRGSGTLQYYNDGFIVYDTDEISEQNVSGYEYSYVVYEGEELSDNTIVENQNDEGIVKNKKNVYFPLSDYLKGDVNMNGKIELQDVIIVAKHLVGSITLSEAEFNLADFNSDGDVTLHDAIDMAKYLLNK